MDKKQCLNKNAKQRSHKNTISIQVHSNTKAIFMKSPLLFSIVLIATTACAELKADIDSDADGLLNSQEETLGTDIENPDSDGDGHLDGIEHDAGFDPMDPESHPYMGGYDTALCNPAPTPTGYAVGSISHDFTLVDQYGEDVTLSDFCGKTVMLETSAFW